MNNNENKILVFLLYVFDVFVYHDIDIQIQFL